jgi:hypothetical protein
VPGTCRKLCCSSTDCGALEETCTPFDATLGTLGYCSGTGGTPPDGTATDPTLPSGCYSGAAPMCNPVTNGGCDAGTACDYSDNGDPNFEPAVACYGGDNTQGPGVSCDVASGPWCVPGFHCVAN